jgi:hypothetical protein
MKSITTMILIALVCSTADFKAYAESKSGANDRAVQSIKAEVQKRGEHSLVKVSLRNGGELKGYIGHIGETSFQVANRNGSEPVTVSYADVAKVRRSSMSKGAKIALVAGLAAAVVVVIGLALSSRGE